MAAKPFGPVGIIDIGSNSVRFVAYGGSERVPSVLFNEKADGGARPRRGPRRQAQRRGNRPHAGGAGAISSAGQGNEAQAAPYRGNRRRTRRRQRQGVPQASHRNRAQASSDSAAARKPSSRAWGRFRHSGCERDRRRPWRRQPGVDRRGPRRGRGGDHAAAGRIPAWDPIPTAGRSPEPFAPVSSRAGSRTRPEGTAFTWSAGRFVRWRCLT